MRLLSTTFRCVKPRALNPNPNPSLENPASSSKSGTWRPKLNSNLKPVSKSWCVYLIVSTNPPIKTYVGATNDFSRRLKQHNGELKGGAKASCAGRPWVCACIVHGFNNQSEACEFESKWKTCSRKLPRKRKNDDPTKQFEQGSLPLLQHRQAALNRVKGLLDCSHLEIDWQVEPLIV
ncbi:hypothetical protein SLA2020_249140 [Shorea laevis]